MLICFHSTSAFCTSNYDPSSVSRYQVVDLSANATENSNIIDISGGIKNHGFSKVCGHVIIYLLDKNQTVVHSVEAEVNSHHAFGHGQVGTFDTTIDISALNNLQSVSVEFVKASS